MSDYAARVSLDTKNYEQPLKQLLTVVAAFNRETERTERVQKMIGNTVKRSSNVFVEYREEIKKVADLKAALVRAQEKYNAAAKKGAELTDEDARAMGAASDLMVRISTKISEATTKINTLRTKGGLKPLTADIKGLGNATVDIGGKLKVATRELDAFQKKYAHFGALKGMDFGGGLAAELQQLGASGKEVAAAKRLANNVKHAYYETFSDPTFQEAMRVDKLLGNAGKISESIRTQFANISSAMKPYISSNQQAKTLQAEIVALLKEEKGIRAAMAINTTKAGRKKLQSRLEDVGSALEDKKDMLAGIAQQSVMGGFTGLDISKIKLTNHLDKIRQQELANNINKQLGAIPIQDQQKTLNDFYSLDPKVAGKARQQYAPLYAAGEEYYQFVQGLHDRVRIAEEQAGNEGFEEIRRSARRNEKERKRQAEEMARAKEAMVLKEHDAVLALPSVQKMIPEGTHFGQKIQVIKQVDELALAFARTGMKASEFDRTMESIRQGNPAIIRQFKEVAQQLRRVEVAANETDKTVMRLSLTGESLARLTGARILTHVFYMLTTQMYETANAAKEINKQIALIETISQRIPQSTKQWQGDIKQLSNKYALPQEDVGKAIYETISNQIAEGPAATDIQNVIAPFAMTTGSTLADSVNLISSALNSFNLEGTQAKEVAAQLFNTIDLGRVTATDMANTYGRLGTFTKQANVSMAEMNAMISLLTIKGLKFERASTFIINVMNKLAKPTPAFSQFLKEQGANSGEEAIAMFGLPGILQRLFSANQGSLDELGTMVQDIRAMIGYAGLLQDLPQLQSNIDQIANNSMPAYDRAMATVMESSAVVVGREGQKIRNEFIEIATSVLNTLAALERFGQGAGLHLSTAAYLASGALSVLGTGFAVRSARSAAYGPDKSKIVGSAISDYAAQEAAGVGLTLRQRLARKIFEKEAKALAAKEAKGLIGPGLGAATLTAGPQIAMVVAAEATLVYAITKNAKAIDSAINSMINGTKDFTADAAKDFADIEKNARETAKIVRDYQKEALKDQAETFAEEEKLQKQKLENYKTAFDKEIDLITRRGKAENDILGGIGSFLLGRYKDNTDYQIGLLRRPEDQLAAKGQNLASQRGTIMDTLGVDPELANQLFESWLNDVQSLRKETMSFATENQGKRGQAEGFLGSTDQMVNEMIGAFMKQFGIAPTGNVVGDLVAIRKEVRNREEGMQQFAELKKFLESRIEAGLDSWERTAKAVETLNDKQQALFAGLISQSPAGTALANVVAQQGYIESEKRRNRKDQTEIRSTGATMGFQGELAQFLDLSNKNGALSELMGDITPALQHLAIWHNDVSALRSQQAGLIDQTQEWGRAVKEAGEVTPELSKAATDILQGYQDLATKTGRKLIENTDSFLGSRFDSASLGTYYDPITQGTTRLNDIAKRASLYATGNPAYTDLLDPNTSTLNAKEFMEKARTSKVDQTAQPVTLGDGSIMISVDQLNVDPRSLNFDVPDEAYKAQGGRIGGPRGTDTIPAWLTPGEFVINAKSAAKHRHMLERINNSQYYDDGGAVHYIQASDHNPNLPIYNTPSYTQDDMDEYMRKRKERLSGGYVRGPHAAYDNAGRKIYTNADIQAYKDEYHPQGVMMNNMYREYTSDWKTRDRDHQAAYDKARAHEYVMNLLKPTVKSKKKNYYREMMEQVRSQGQNNNIIANDNMGLMAGGGILAGLMALLGAYGVIGAGSLVTGAGATAATGSSGFAPSFGALSPFFQEIAAGSMGGMEGIPTAAYGGNGLAALQGLLPLLTSPLGFMTGGRIPRSYNINPRSNYMAGGGAVSNSTVVNAEINLTSTGSTERDVRAIVRGINREAHRGGLSIGK